MEIYKIGNTIYWVIIGKNCLHSLEGVILFFVFFNEDKVTRILFKFEQINVDGEEENPNFFPDYGNDVRDW